DRFEEGAEVAFAEALVALALDELEEDRPEHRAGEDLQEHARHGAAALADLHGALAVDEDAVLLQPLHVLAVAGHARIHLLVIGGGRGGHEGQAVRPQALDAPVDVTAAAGDVLDAFALVVLEVFLDLALVVDRFVDRDADLAAGAGDGAADEAGQLALDIEEADLLEVEQLLIEARPHVHAPAVHIVGEMVDVIEADALRLLLGPGQRFEIGHPVVALVGDEI